MQTAPDITASDMLPARLPKGFVLGDYVVDGWLRDGGMAAIYRAHRASDGRRVALKVQLPSTAHDAATGGCFDAEADVMRRVGGTAHVVELFEAGVLDDGRRYLVMEWVDGEDLEELLDFLRDQDRRLEISRACRIGRDVARGLAELHEHGVVHLDLKPANVMVGQAEDGRDEIKLVDFGIAADLRERSKKGEPVAGAVAMGTSSYMSPQQAKGDPSEPTFDLYALGVLLFEILSGRRLPPDGWTPDILPPLQTLRRGVPQVLAELVRACMDFEPARRPASAQAVAKALVGIIGKLEGGGGRARAASVQEVPVRTGGTELVPRSSVVGAAATAGVGAEAAVGVGVEAAVGGGVEAAAGVGVEGGAAARDWVEVPVRTGGTESALTHEEVLRSSQMLPLVTPEMVADAMDRLAAEEEAREQASRGWRRWGVLGAVVALVLGIGWWVTRGEERDEPSEVAAKEPLGSAIAGSVAMVETVDGGGRGVDGARPKTDAASEREGSGNDAGGDEGLTDVAVEATAREVGADEEMETDVAVEAAAREVGADEGMETDVAVEAEPASDPAAESKESKRAKAAKSRRAKGLSEEQCEALRIDAVVAMKARSWRWVLRSTAQRSCWTRPEQRLERKRLRVAAYAETGEFASCVKEAGRSRDEEISQRASYCKKKLSEGGTGAGL